MSMLSADFLLDKLIRECARDLFYKHLDIQAKAHTISWNTKVIEALVDYKHFMNLNEPVLGSEKSIEPVNSKLILEINEQRSIKNSTRNSVTS